MKKTILESIRALLATETKLETVETTEGTVIYAEVFEPGEAVFIEEGEERIPLPVGEYPLADGMVLVVEEEGIIASLAEGEAEEPAEEEPAEEEMSDDERNQLKEIIRSVIEEMMAEEMEKAKDEPDEVGELKKEVEELRAQMEKIPAPNKPKPNPNGRKKKTNLKGMAKQTPGTTKEKVFAKLYQNY